MLVTFKSKAAAEVPMYKEHAKRILDLLSKDVTRGVIASNEIDAAINALETEVANPRAHPVSEEVQRDVAAHHGAQGDDNEHEAHELVNFATRVYPLLEMLRAARRQGEVVAWGI